MLQSSNSLKTTDPDISGLISQELATLELILLYDFILMG